MSTLLDQGSIINVGIGSFAQAVRLAGGKAEQVAWTRELFGEIEPSLQVNFANLSEEVGRRQLELLAAHVLPRFADAPTAAR